jgi:hypothetical protein
VNHEQVGETKLQVEEKLPPFSYGSHDSSKVVVEEYNRCNFPCGAGSSLSHRNAYVSPLQRRNIIHSVSGHRNDLTRALQRPDQFELLRRYGAGDYVDIEDAGNVIATQVFGQVGTFDYTGTSGADTELTCYGHGRGGVIAGYHDDMNLGSSSARHGIGDTIPNGIFER